MSSRRLLVPPDSGTEENYLFWKCVAPLLLSLATHQ